MARVKWQKLRTNWWQSLCILFFLWLALVLWPIKGWLWPGSWWGETLIVVMNENEARPCGGFATAYGELNLPWPNLSISNAYELNADLGNAPEPLTQVSDRLYFWDLGTSPDLATCADAFTEGYQINTNQTPDQTILLQMQVLERWAALLSNNDFFTATSRAVANVDRHDEDTLASRKNNAGSELRTLLGQTITRPWVWRSVTKTWQQAADEQMLYHSDWKEEYSYLPRINVGEWNLGGGKSSRYLDKNITLRFKEITPGNWQGEARLQVYHLGGWDAPLSQDWQGVFAVSVFGQEPIIIPAAIKTGESFEATVELSEVPTKPFDLRSYPGQAWHTKVLVQPFPQQRVMSHYLDARESTGRFSGLLKSDENLFHWSVEPDKTPPFLTLHKPINPNLLDANVRQTLNWSEDDLMVELHFNEVFETQNFSATLKDRNYSVPEISENPVFKQAYQLNPNTLLLNFSQNKYQVDERFHLSLEGVNDLWGNTYQNQLRTVITR